LISSRTTRAFRDGFAKLPEEIKRHARRAYNVFRRNPYHQSLQFKRLKDHERVFSVRIGLHYRALGLLENDDTIVWFWIGSHADYDRLI